MLRWLIAHKSLSPETACKFNWDFGGINPISPIHRNVLGKDLYQSSPGKIAQLEKDFPKMEQSVSRNYKATHLYALMSYHNDFGCSTPLTLTWKIRINTNANHVFCSTCSGSGSFLLSFLGSHFASGPSVFLIFPGKAAENADSK